MIAAIALGTLLAVPMFAVGLVLLVVVRWLVEGWQPATIPDEPLDFAALTIAGIPVEDLGLPDLT